MMLSKEDKKKLAKELISDPETRDIIFKEMAKGIGRRTLVAGGIGALIGAAVGTNPAIDWVTDENSLKDASSVIIDQVTINRLFTANPNAEDIGAEINNIHDNNCIDGDAVFVPPGIYRNQNTKIEITKRITLFSTGDFKSPGATIKKQSDIESLQTSCSRSNASGQIDRSINVIGMMFDGSDVSDSSNGVRIRGAGHISIASHNHGSVGVLLTTEDQGEDVYDLNGAILEVVANSNGGDGISDNAVDIRGGINMNTMKCHFEANNNGGKGVSITNGYSNKFKVWTQSNADMGCEITSNKHYGMLHIEANGANSELSGDYSVWNVQNTSDVDTSKISSSSVLVRGKIKYGKSHVQASLPSNYFYTTAGDGNLRLPLASEIYDSKGEYDAANETLSVNRTGMYYISYSVWISGFTDQSKVELKFANETDGTNVIHKIEQTLGIGDIIINCCGIFKLIAGKNYKPRFHSTCDCTIEDNNDGTFLVVTETDLPH